jgi:predicted GTPase
MGNVLRFDGGNNYLPFYRRTVNIVVADPLRVGHESRYHPSETNVRMPTPAGGSSTGGG